MEYTVELKEWEDQFYNALVGTRLKDISLIQVNPKYFAFDVERVWVLDGGIELTLEDGRKMTYAWNKDVELMDLQFGEPDSLLLDLDFYVINEISEKVMSSLHDKKILDVEFEWNWYQMLNEDFELEDEFHYAPLGMTLAFEDNQTLQLASIRFQLDGQTLANAHYLPEGDMLVSLNELIPITLLEDGEEPE
jgi:hypothetical protein